MVEEFYVIAGAFLFSFIPAVVVFLLMPKGGSTENAATENYFYAAAAGIGAWALCFWVLLRVL